MIYFESGEVFFAKKFESVYADEFWYLVLFWILNERAISR